MGQTVQRQRAARSLSLGVAGLFVGHLLVYRLVAPNPLQRAALLIASGHGYLPTALALGAGLAVLAGIGTFCLGLRRGSAAQPMRLPGLLRALMVPAVAQAAAFLLIEVLERALAGAPMAGLLGPLLPVGMLLQLVVGALGGLLIHGLERAGERLGAAAEVRARWARRRLLALVARPGPVRASAAQLWTACGIRGPPAPA